MQTHTTRLIPVAGVMAAASMLALGGCGHSASRTATPPPASGALSATGHPAILASHTPAAGSSSGAGTITTTGTATVNGTPDTMTVSIRVSTSGVHAAAALARNNALTLAVQHALERDGVAVKDIQTTDLSLQENYPPSPAGFEVDHEVSATLRDLARAGSAIDDAAAAAGDAGRLDGVNFSISDTSPLMGAARQTAVTAARTDAGELAAAAGEHLAGLRSLTDVTEQNPPVYPQNAAAAGSASSVPVPVQPGTQQLSVVVTAVWDLSR